ncbi:MAG: 2-amino-4-hydroxy-6-hydroxymethyldihydropteridine diphosphokinase [Gammaproteobacteria bacterium]
MFVGLGSNLNSPVDQVRQALKAIAEIDGVALRSVSRLFHSAPMGPQDQPDYVNAVAWVESELQPLELLSRLQEIELSQGRDRNAGLRWGPRTIDLDLLAWGASVIDEANLNIPHPGIADREFVLHPWLDLAPEFAIPGLDTVKALADKVPLRGMRPMEHASTPASVEA